MSSSSKWKDAKLVGRVVGANEENSNKGGFVVEVAPSDGSPPEEVGRVAFDRTEAEDSHMTFERKLDQVIKIARKSVGTLNDLFAKAGELQ